MRGAVVGPWRAGSSRRSRSGAAGGGLGTWACLGALGVLLALLANSLAGLRTAAADGGLSLFVSGTQAEASEFPVRVRAVVSVTNADGEPVVGLDPAAFALAENGRAVEVRGATLTTSTDGPSGAVPLRVGLLLDISRSMVEPLPGTRIIPWNAVRPAAEQFVAALRPDDQLCVYGFHEELVAPPSNCATKGRDGVALRNAINRLAPGRRSMPLGEAVHELAGRLDREFPVTNRAIVLVTDGADPDGDGRRPSPRPLDSVTARVRELRTPVIAIGVGSETAVDFPALAAMANGSGGLAARADVADAHTVATVLTRARERLVGQYVVTYLTGVDEGTYPLEVTAKTPTGSVTASGLVTIPTAPVGLTILARASESQLHVSATATGQRKALDAHRLALAVRDAAGVETTLATHPADSAAYVWDREHLPAGEYHLVARLLGDEGTAVHEAQAGPLRWPEPTAVPTQPVAPTVEREPSLVLAPGAAPLPAPVLAPGPVVVVVSLVMLLIVVVSFRQNDQAGRRGALPRAFYEAVERTRTGLQARARGADRPVSAQLTVLDGPDRGVVFPIRATNTMVGRGAKDNDISLREAYASVSRAHAEIILADGGIHIRDRNSRHGTYVIDRQGGMVRVGSNATVEVRKGSQVMLHDIRCRVDLKVPRGRRGRPAQGARPADDTRAARPTTVLPGLARSVDGPT